MKKSVLFLYATNDKNNQVFMHMEKIFTLKFKHLAEYSAFDKNHYFVQL